jgi:L-ascorbate metabolism protein UlaG (beta-lactamase superfamily)
MNTRILYVIIIIIVFQSCIKIKHSPLREPNPESIEIAGCTISSTGAVYMNIFGIIKADFISAGVKIKSDDILLYIDPLVIDDTAKADYIFITHNHLDHFSMPDIHKLSKPETIIIGPEPVTKKLQGKIVKTVSVGDTLDMGSVKYEVVESYNLNSKIHKKGNKNVGYIISCDTTRIYIAGDTDFIPEMEAFENITVAIIPIGEGKTAMNPQTASKAANLINPRIVIPIHYELEQNREKEFLELVDKHIEVKFLNSH